MARKDSLELPNDIWLSIIRLLDPKAVVALLLAAKKFQKLIDNSDNKIWQDFIKTLPSKNSVSCKDVFFKQVHLRKAEYLHYGKKGISYNKEFSEMVKDIIAELTNENAKQIETRLFQLVAQDVNYVTVILYEANQTLKNRIDNFFLKDLITLQPGCCTIILNHTDEEILGQIDYYVLKNMVESNEEAIASILNHPNPLVTKYIDRHLLRIMLEKDPGCLNLIAEHKNDEIKSMYQHLLSEGFKVSQISLVGSKQNITPVGKDDKKCRIM